MYTGNYVHWDHYPKYLYYYEVTHPLEVLREFFDADLPENHAVALKGWRDISVSWQCFEDKRYGPESILYVYQLNVKLMEALYLLLLEHEEPWHRPEPIQVQQLEAEKADWLYFPDNLPGEQPLDPYVYVREFFADISLPKYRDYLMQWLKDALTIKHMEDNILTTQEILAVYENMLKLYSAAWMIYQRSTKEPYFKDAEHAGGVNKDANTADHREENTHTADNAEQSAVTYSVTPVPETSVRLRKLFDTDLTYAGSLGLTALIALITEKVANIEMIVYLGQHANPFTYYLVILLAEEEKTPEHEVSNRIEDLCRGLSSVYAIVHKTASAVTGINGGKRFWTMVTNKGPVPYRVPGLTLPEHAPVPDQVWRQRAEKDWQRWGSQGRAFLEGAAYYSEKGNNQLAAFLLHQAVESTLIGIIKAVTGYRVCMHNLARMLRITLLFTDYIKAVLSLHTKEGVQLFALLQGAYSEARYKENYRPDEQSVRALTVTVTSLLNKADQVYQQFIADVQNIKDDIIDR